MEPVVEMISRMGIGKHEPYLSTALGAGSTTVEKITNAYAMLANHGRALKPRVIDYAQDRRGKVIFPKNWKPCEGCNMKDWDGRSEEHTSELQSLMRISYAVFCLKKKNTNK